MRSLTLLLNKTGGFGRGRRVEGPDLQLEGGRVKKLHPAKPGMGEIPYWRAAYSVLFYFIILFFSIPASWRASQMGLPAAPCPALSLFPLSPLFSIVFC